MVIHQYEALLRRRPGLCGARARAVATAPTSSRSSSWTCWASPTSARPPSAQARLSRLLSRPARPRRARRSRGAARGRARARRFVRWPEADVCCGFGGLFAVKMPDISSAMLARKLDRIEESGADTVVVTDVSCGMHMAGGLHRRGSRVARPPPRGGPRRPERRRDERDREHVAVSFHRRAEDALATARHGAAPCRT